MDDRHYGGFWRRMVAFIIDKTIIYALSLNLSLIVILAVGLEGNMMVLLRSPIEEVTAQIGAWASLCVFLSIVIDMVYFTWFIGVGGQTPGKMLLRLRVVFASGEPPTPGTAFLRWAGTILSGMFFFLGFFWIALDRRKQGWHDKIAMTFVETVAKGSQTSHAPQPARVDPLLHEEPAKQADDSLSANTTILSVDESRDEKGLDKQNKIL